jgi:predicted enzyme related to lactoylglutathione lyase
MGSAVRGYFIWHDLLTTDPRAAVAFYGRVIGWRSQPWDQDASYTILLSGDTPLAGATTLPDSARRMAAPPNWLPYIGTDDAEVAAWEAQRLGGRVIRDTAALPTVGKFAVLADPQGAVFAVLQPEDEAKLSWPAPLRDFSWHELATTDPAAAFRFYSALFGWKKTSSFDMGPEAGVYQMYGFPGREMGGIYRKPAEMKGPPNWSSYIRVADARATARAAENAGAKIINGPMEVPNGDWITVAMDPQGAVFAVHSVKAAAKVARKVARKRAGKGKKATKVAGKVAKRKTPKKLRKGTRRR